MKHTKGPWIVSETPHAEGLYFGIGRVADPHWVARVLTHVSRSDEETEANAILISYAPEMLEMLKKCVKTMAAMQHYCSALGFDKTEINEAIKIINKAKGRY